MPIEWSNLYFNKNPFFLESLTSDSQLKFFGNRKFEIEDMVDNIKNGSMPFVLEGGVGSGKTTLLTKVANELIDDDGTNLKENECFLLVIVNSEDLIDGMNGGDLRKFAFSKLMYLILTEKRLDHILKKIRAIGANELPAGLFMGDENVSDLMERFEMPHMSFEQLVSQATKGGKVIFALDDLDKIEDYNVLHDFVKKWRHTVQEIPGVSTIYVGNYGLDSNLRGVPGFFAHAPTRMRKFNKGDLENILDKRISILCDGEKYSSVNEFLEEDIWNLFHQVNRGERIRWILQTLSRVIENYMSRVEENEIKIPIGYTNILDCIIELSEEALTVSDSLIPITNRLVEIFLDSIEHLTAGELTDDDWTSYGIWRAHDNLIGVEVVVDGVIDALPVAPQTIGAYLNELEKLGLLASKTIRRRKYYLPSDDFMLFLKIKMNTIHRKL